MLRLEKRVRISEKNRESNALRIAVIGRLQENVKCYFNAYFFGVTDLGHHLRKVKREVK